MTPRPALIAAVVALATLTSTACAAPRADVRPPVGEAKAAVYLAAEETGRQSYRMTMTMEPELALEASIDPVADAGSATSTTETMTSETVTIGADVWGRTEFSWAPGPGTWYHWTVEDFGPAASAAQIDPGEFLRTAADVVQVDTVTFTGVLDMSGTAAIGISVADGARTSSSFTEAPFTLTLDDQGRPSHVEIALAGVGTDGGDRTVVVTITDYGTPVEVSPPPADQVEELAGALD